MIMEVFMPIVVSTIAFMRWGFSTMLGKIEARTG